MRMLNFSSIKKAQTISQPKKTAQRWLIKSTFFTQFRYDSLQRAKEKQKLMLDSEKTNKTSLNLSERPYPGTVG